MKRLTIEAEEDMMEYALEIVKEQLSQGYTSGIDPTWNI